MNGLCNAIAAFRLRLSIRVRHNPKEYLSPATGGELVVRDSRGRLREDIIQLSWDDIMEMCRDLSLKVQKEFDPDIIVGIAKAGVIPAVIIASILRRDFYPVKISRRRKDIVVKERPELMVPFTDEVAGKNVLIVDEMSATGETLRLAKREAEKKGARRVRTLTLYVRSDSYMPNYFALQSDALIIQPWDYEVLDRGKFIVHPEYQAELDRI